MLEATFRYDTPGQVVRTPEGFEVVSTENVRAQVHLHDMQSINLNLYRVCDVCSDKGYVVGKHDVPLAQATFVGNALSPDLKGWANTVELCGASEEETHSVVHRLLFAALANVPTFRDEVAQALPKWTSMLVELWNREGPTVNVTLDWGGVWRSLTVRPMGKRPTVDDTRGFNIKELERCRDACLDAADMLADRVSKAKRGED